MFVSEYDTVAQVVGRNFTAAEIFEELGVDYCSKGHLTLAEACKKYGVDVERLTGLLGQMAQEPPTKLVDFSEWPADLLADYVEKIHHRYMVDTTPRIRTLLDALVLRNARQHPEWKEARTLFNTCADEFINHHIKEETILFPYIRELVTAKQAGRQLSPRAYSNIEYTIQVLELEHAHEGDRFATMAALTNDFTPPAGATPEWMELCQLLKDYVEDLHKHIFIENYLLFPAAIELEKTVIIEV
jgi:regulator of cell morphogenesis and NO signaling